MTRRWAASEAEESAVQAFCGDDAGYGDGAPGVRGAGGCRRLMTGPQKPILLLAKKKTHEAGASVLSEALAPGNPNIGVMLPYTPVHMLLFRYPEEENSQEPAMPEVLVMTSGNPSGAPICMTDAEAEKYLAPMCDEILSNPRKIRIRADDSVMSFTGINPI